ncbi:uncharacterized protein F5Z01DRAFT_230852 [Emericellopsis atlantica]|uniref:F-box domain-containing protein n=1 Tax=Emericellopsis atlantica TaxID=2614577 RepID=A0A9P7ZI05_9HYPO|nr:uncharacterized protein F5Z01DRAFT_230852 [Emericellopsis atlantica]KAG9252488.1 hypothetical protein F5Z01DRAFT_230852 [Emericellopsis atlantica]
MKINQLPLEVVANILSSLESLTELTEAILACRHFYAAFLENPHIPGTIVYSTFDNGEVLPLAVAALRTGKLGTRFANSDEVLRFVDDLRVLRHLDRELRSMRLHELYDLHDLTDAVTEAAFDWANLAWHNYEEDHNCDFGLSLAEAARFCRVLYRTEIFLRVFRVDDALDEDAKERVELEGQLWLLKSFCMFEIEQIACAHDYMESRIVFASRFILAHDIEAGAMQIDYLTLGENPLRQKWITRGCVWLAKLIRLKKDVAARRDLLAKSLDGENAHLYGVLWRLKELYRGPNSKLKLCPKQPRQVIDNDPGPPSAFDYAHTNTDIDLTVDIGPNGETPDYPILVTFAHDDSGLREQAYVMWDLSRIKDWDLFHEMEIVPSASRAAPEPGWYTEMRRSWAARRKLYEQGERGTWRLERPWSDVSAMDEAVASEELWYTMSAFEGRH